MPKKKSSKLENKVKKKEDQSQLVAILSYIPIIGWVIALVLNMNNKSKLGRFHLRQSLLIMLTGIVLCWIPVLGWILCIAVFVFWLMGLIAAINSEEKEVPLIGKYAQEWFKGL
jgi:uncharacterized membrane protein